MQGTRVQSLVREDPTHHRATKPVHRSYWACALEPTSHNYWSPRATATEAHEPQLSLRATATESHVPRAHALQQEKPPQWEARALQQLIAPVHCN